MAFKIHGPNDACFKPCPTKIVINNSAQTQYPTLMDKHWFRIVCILLFNF